jgi:hypothetical protein
MPIVYSSSSWGLWSSHSLVVGGGVATVFCNDDVACGVATLWLLVVVLRRCSVMMMLHVE